MWFCPTFRKLMFLCFCFTSASENIWTLLAKEQQSKKPISDSFGYSINFSKYSKNPFMKCFLLPLDHGINLFSVCTLMPRYRPDPIFSSDRLQGVPHQPATLGISGRSQRAPVLSSLEGMARSSRRHGQEDLRSWIKKGLGVLRGD